MTAAVACPKCGTMNPSNQKFCGECGNAVLSITAPPAPDPELQQEAIAQRVVEAAVTCPICHEQVHPTPTYDCPKCRANLTGVLRRTGVLPTSNPAMPVSTIAPESTSESSFSFSGCIVSFLITFGIAVTLGVAGIFILGLILTSTFKLSGANVVYCTGTVYLTLFGIIWWAIYTQMQKRKR